MKNTPELPDPGIGSLSHGSGSDRIRWEAFPEELPGLVKTLGEWIRNPLDSDLERLRPSFQTLARAFRARGFSLEETLDALGEVEDVLLVELVGEGAEAASYHTPPTVATMGGPPGLRRAMRLLVKETVWLNLRLEGRRNREYGDALSGFGEVLSHELGNRLGAARTGLELLQESPDMDSSRRQEVICLVAAGIDAVLTTVDDVAAYMDAEAWVEGVGIPFAHVARRVARGLYPLARRQGVELKIREPLPEVGVEGSRIRLILSNLLTNGIRYSDHEKSDSWVELAAGTGGDGSIEVEVADNGIGIEPNDQQRIFHYLERGGTPGRRPSGSGLGLAIVWEAVQQLGGRIQLESRPGVGSSFRFRVPKESPR